MPLNVVIDFFAQCVSSFFFSEAACPVLSSFHLNRENCSKENSDLAQTVNGFNQCFMWIDQFGLLLSQTLSRIINVIFSPEKSEQYFYGIN